MLAGISMALSMLELVGSSGEARKTFQMSSSSTSTLWARINQPLSLISPKRYKNIMENCMENARTLRTRIEKNGRLDIISKEIGVPLVAFSLKVSSKHRVFEISENLRPRCPAHIVLRVVVREDFNRALAERLVSDIQMVLVELDAQPSRAAAVAQVIAEQKNEADGIIMKKSVSQIKRMLQRTGGDLLIGRRLMVSAELLPSYECHMKLILFVYQSRGSMFPRHIL